MTSDNRHQRKGADNNAQVGRDFEDKVKEYFEATGLRFIPHYSINIGITAKKYHKFDLVDTDQNVIVECKAHTWTEGKNVPSAKMTTWNEAMLYFFVTPNVFRKILVVLRDYSSEKKETLGQYYLRTYQHLIPDNVEVWEYDISRASALKIR